MPTPPDANPTSNPDDDELLAYLKKANAELDADRRRYLTRVMGAVRSHAVGVPGLRDAYINHAMDELIFVGDEWSHELATKVGEIMDIIGDEVENGITHWFRGGLRLGADGLENYCRVPLR